MKIDLVPHEVIENQLLVALNDKSKVGILASQDDLRMLIIGLGDTLRYLDCDKCRELRVSLMKLMDAAFPHYLRRYSTQIKYHIA